MSRTAIFWLAILSMFVIVLRLAEGPNMQTDEISYSDFRQEVENKSISSVKIEGTDITGEYVGGSKLFKTVMPKDDGLVDRLMEAGVEIKAAKPNVQPWYVVVLSSALPILLIVGFWFFIMRQMQMGGSKGMSFGKARAKLLTESQQKVTFEDVAGIDEARAELEEIIGFLKDPKKFTRLGGRIPKGVLLVGSPGTGKTLLAKAIAGEAGVPFFSISGSDFVEMFVGVGASRVRDLFVQGKKHAPCIIFIDEIDAVGRQRGAGMGGGHDEREQTLNQLLVEMDGFESNEGVILIAATNRPDVLDPALLRPGRFDRRVIVPTPDLNGRLGILNVHSRKTPLNDDVDLREIARGTPGFSGADLEILVNEAALNAARLGQDDVAREDFEFAKDKVMMGAERRSMLLSEKEKETTAYHESGHALVAKMLKNTDPVHKLTIIPRGQALGLMQQLPENDKHTYSRSYWHDQLAVFFGGRIAEDIIFSECNTGASSDIQRATQIARRMVTEWGMSDKLGPVNYATKEEHMFLGKELGKAREHSEHTQVMIDEEVAKILGDSEALARKILTENIDTLHSLAKALIKFETLNAEQIDTVINGGDLGEGPDTGSAEPVKKESLEKTPEDQKTSKKLKPVTAS